MCRMVNDIASNLKLIRGITICLVEIRCISRYRSSVLTSNDTACGDHRHGDNNARGGKVLLEEKRPHDENDYRCTSFDHTVHRDVHAA